MPERVGARQLQWQMLLEGVKAVRFYLTAEVALSSDLFFFSVVILLLATWEEEGLLFSCSFPPFVRQTFRY